MFLDELIADMDSGSVNSEGSGVLRDLMAKLNEHAQRNQKAKGEFTLKLAFLATANGRVEITSDIKAKAPAPPRTSETRWLGDKGALLPADPRQENLPLKAAPRASTALKNVSPTTPPQAGE